MTDFRAQATIGARIREARRERGLKTARELADAIPGGKITASIIQNIESGRKADLNLSELLNIAKALNVSPSYLLAPLTTPNASLDLPNLSEAFDDTTSAELDAWLSAVPLGAYRSASASERAEVDQLGAFRELSGLIREHSRLQTMRNVEAQSEDADLRSALDLTQHRLDTVESEIERLTSYLRTNGWQV
jgi:transcriptional regulator with XRE-family HTH domain